MTTSRSRILPVRRLEGWLCMLAALMLMNAGVGEGLPFADPPPSPPPHMADSSLDLPINPTIATTIVVAPTTTTGLPEPESPDRTNADNPNSWYRFTQRFDILPLVIVLAIIVTCIPSVGRIDLRYNRTPAQLFGYTGLPNSDDNNNNNNNSNSSNNNANDDNFDRDFPSTQQLAAARTPVPQPRLARLWDKHVAPLVDALTAKVWQTTLGARWRRSSLSSVDSGDSDASHDTAHTSVGDDDDDDAGDGTGDAFDDAVDGRPEMQEIASRASGQGMNACQQAREEIPRTPLEAIFARATAPVSSLHSSESHDSELFPMAAAHPQVYRLNPSASLVFGHSGCSSKPV
ncbi:hypothetical protein CAOG_004039 [Capsaspora owczarzaki ATCC 30864]|uniref:Uncharacterized protein n=2 Tax=Capsaspora owczarzaki (strain ATCC 30864) TaxID=595528 RepID=A0A0D2WPE3_CAPO3|nr:hypothetical protein CAOG_004039 [Capsaspora owczarzaki ATCC 30864]